MEEQGKTYTIAALMKYLNIGINTLKMYLCRAEFAHTKLAHRGVVEVLNNVKKEDIKTLRFLLKRKRKRKNKTS